MATQKKSKEIKARVDSENAMRAFATETGAYEDFKPKVYWDKIAKKWTIGHGFNLDAAGTANYLTSQGYNVADLRSGKAQLSKDQSLNLLNGLFTQAYDQARNFVPNFDTLPEKARYILADMTYNMGYSKLTGFGKMQKALAANDYNEAAVQLKDSDYYKQVGRRSKAHYNEFLALRDAALKTNPAPTNSVIPTPLFGIDLNTMQPTMQPGKLGPTQEKASHIGYTNMFIPETDFDRKIKDLQWSGMQWVPSNQIAKKYEPTMWENAKQTVKGWLHDFEDSSEETPSTNTPTFKQGGDVPSIQKTNTSGSYFSPTENTIYLNSQDARNPSVLPHELYHYNQWLNGDFAVDPDTYFNELRKQKYLPENFHEGQFSDNLNYNIPLRMPSIAEREENQNNFTYYNRRPVEQQALTNDFLFHNPSFNLVDPELVYEKKINPEMYETPWTLEGEAEQVGNQYIGPYKQGGLIKRADGSYSRRGLWDNIRANRGSGRKPTAAMLEQERKIKKKEDGSFVEGEDPKTNKVQGNNPLMNLSEAQRFPAPVQTTVTYPEGYVNQMFDLKNPVLNTMGKPYATGAVEQSVSPLDFIGAAKGAIGLGKGLLKYRNLMKPNYVELGGQMIDIGAHPRAVNRAVNQMHKGAQQVALPSPFADGSWVEDSSLPTPTTPPFYGAGEDRTLTNYQMGTDKARMYAAGSTVWTNQDTPLWAAGTPTPTATQNFRNTGSLNPNRYLIGGKDIIPTGMNYKTPAAGTHDYNKDVQPYHTMRLHAPDTTMMARHGGHIKKHINSPRVYGNPVNPSGMYGDGSTVGYDQAKAQYIKASNMGPMGENQMQQLVKQFPQLANDASLAGYRSVGNAAMFRNNEEANRIETNTLGQVLSTPASRKKAQREEIVKRRPEVYNVEDYKMGIQEPGASNDLLDDPIAMAIIGTATGGVGLSARGVRALTTDFAGNLASEATMGAADLTKGGFKIGENLFKNIKTPKVIQNFSDAYKSTKSLMGEVKGELLHGFENRKAIQEGNEWFANWVAHPKTQTKIEDSINKAIDLRNQYYHQDVTKHVEDLNNGVINQIQFNNFINDINLDYNHEVGKLDLFKEQAKNYKNYSQEYPLKKQFEENFLQYFGKGDENIHLDNAGMSYVHHKKPYGTLLGMSTSLRNSGNWISRKYPNFLKKAGTAIHENTHGWATNFGLGASGQKNFILSLMPKEVKANYLEWKNLGGGEKAFKELGEKNAFKGYIANPTEMHARTMELRKAFDLTPDDIIDETMATDMMKTMESNRNLITGQEDYLDTFGRDPKKMASLFNNLWVAAPAAIGASMYNAPSTQIEQKQANGGYVKNNNSNTWLDSYN